jgi:hypothetical protein
MKPNPTLPQGSREEIIRQLEQFSVEVLEAALGVLEAREAAAKSAGLGKSDAS